MKLRIPIVAVMMACGIAAAAQMVASHASTVPAVSPGSAVTTASGKPVVRVNGTVLTDHDLLRQMMIEFPYARQHGGRFPKEKEADIRRNALDSLEFEELVYQEALRLKVVVAPAKLTRAMKQFEAQFASKADFQNYVETEHGGSMENLRGKVKRAILIEELLTARVIRKSRLTDLQLRAFYKNNPERFRKPDSVSIQTISLIIPDNATAKQKQDVRKRAEEALRQAKATKNYEEFGMLAERTSEDDWRVMMGDHKSLHRGRMPPQVEKAAFTMSAGQVSDIIETENAFCIVRVNAREKSKLVPFEQVRDRLKRDLEMIQSSQLRKELETRLRKNANIEEL